MQLVEIKEHSFSIVRGLITSLQCDFIGTYISLVVSDSYSYEFQPLHPCSVLDEMMVLMGEHSDRGVGGKARGSMAWVPVKQKACVVTGMNYRLSLSLFNEQSPDQQPLSLSLSLSLSLTLRISYFFQTLSLSNNII